MRRAASSMVHPTSLSCEAANTRPTGVYRLPCGETYHPREGGGRKQEFAKRCFALQHPDGCAKPSVDRAVGG
jgi:hypothetical protein